jgi:phage terminase large subunit
MVLEFEFNTIYSEVFNTDAGIIDIAGGRGRGGSHFVTDYFLYKITQPHYFRGYFMRLIHGDIRNSLYQDFKDRLEEKGHINEKDFDFNESRLEITYLPTGNKILSKGFKKSQGAQTAKLKSIAGATDIAIEECEEIDRDDFNKLADSLRTSKADIKIYRIWNPPHKEHWLIKDYFDIHQHPEYDDYYTFTPKGVKDHLAIISNYKDNLENLNEKAIARFEGYKETNIEHYCTNVLGLVSAGIKGQVYKFWETFSTLPDRTFYRVFGMDFGFENDPTAVAELFIDGDRREVYVYEHFYFTHTRIHDIISKFKNEWKCGNNEVICDNSEPEQRTEMYMAGIYAIKTKKGGKAGNKFKQINVVKGYKVFMHEGSKNLRYEQEVYKWAIDPETKEPMNKPADKDDHLMDAILYAINYYHRNFNIIKQ